MNPNLRATLDPTVIAAWSRQVSARRRRWRFVQPLLLLAIALSVACAVIAKLVALVFVAFALCFVLVIASLVEYSSPACPHCGENPFGSFMRGDMSTVDFCTHCRYWLKDPRGDHAHSGDS